MATKYLQEFESTTAFLAASPDAGSVVGVGVVSDVVYINAGGTAIPVTLGSQLTVTPTGAVTLTAAQSGFNVLLNAAAGFAITLPAVAAGLRYRFTVAAAFASTNFTVVVPGGSNLIEGSIIVAGAVVDADAEDTINFVATAENIGDFVEVWSDGTSWFIFGNALTAGGITVTAT